MRLKAQGNMTTNAITRTVNDPSHDFLLSHRRPLDAFFRPRSAAVIGATDLPGKVGGSVMKNLMANTGLRLYAVNPARDNVFGLQSYKSISSLPPRQS